MAVTGNISIATSFSQTLAGIPGSSAPQVANSQTINCNFRTSGGLADQVDLKYSRTLTLAATPTPLDLKSLTAVDGSAIVFVRIRSITVVVKDTNDSHVVLLGYATTTANAWTALVSNPGQITVEPSTATNAGGFCVTAPNTTGYLVGSSSHLLQLDPGANTVVVDVEIVGCAE